MMAAVSKVSWDLARETSDAVLVRHELTALPKAISLAQRAERVVKVNLAFAATLITVLVASDIFGTLPLPLGVAGHEESTSWCAQRAATPASQGVGDGRLRTGEDGWRTVTSTSPSRLSR